MKFYTLLLSTIAVTAIASTPAFHHDKKHRIRTTTTIPSTSPNIKWVGRMQPNPTTGSMFFDYEGVSASITLSDVSFLMVNISDNCPGSTVGGGSRWLVTMNTTDTTVAAVNHRISTFWTGPLTSLYYMFNNPGQHCDPNCNFGGTTTFTLTRLTESRLSGCVPGGNLSVNSFTTDGTVNSPPPMSSRRLEFVGDSITAGDLNDGAGQNVCGNSAYNDDITYSTGGQLCLATSLGGFGADCLYTAFGGIRLPGTGNPNDWGMKQLYPFTFQSDGQNAYGLYNFTNFPVDAVIINLGTNDHPNAPALVWQAAYVSFVQSVVTTYYQNPDLVVFLAYGPMTNEYQPFVTNITATLVSQGIKANLLDLTLPHPMTGCFGHPSYADNIEIAAKAKPQIAAVLGWSDEDADF